MVDSFFLIQNTKPTLVVVLAIPKQTKSRILIDSAKAMNNENIHKKKSGTFEEPQNQKNASSSIYITGLHHIAIFINKAKQLVIREILYIFYTHTHLRTRN